MPTVIKCTGWSDHTTWYMVYNLTIGQFFIFEFGMITEIDDITVNCSTSDWWRTVDMWYCVCWSPNKVICGCKTEQRNLTWFG